MKEQSVIDRVSSTDWHPIRDSTRALIQSQCPSCKIPMSAFQKDRLDKKKF